MKHIIIVVLFFPIIGFSQLKEVNQLFGNTYRYQKPDSKFYEKEYLFQCKFEPLESTLVKEKEVSDSKIYSGKKKYYTGGKTRFYLKNTSLSEEEYLLYDVNLVTVQYNNNLKRTEYTLFLKNEKTALANIWLYDDSEKIAVSFLYNGSLETLKFNSILVVSNFKLENTSFGY